MPAEIKVFTQQNLQGNKIVNVGAPVADNDVATKASAAADATTKADAALVSANGYTDAQVLAANETVLDAAKAYTDAEITELIGGAPSALDTLNELATALENEQDAVAALVTQISGVETNLATETTNRTNADTTLQGLIDGLDSRLDTAESTLTSLSGGMTAIFEGTATGAGSPTADGFEYTINHALNKSKILVQVFEGNDVVDVFVRKIDNNNLKIITGAALGGTSLKVVVIG
jgi:hypothetical protein